MVLIYKGLDLKNEMDINPYALLEITLDENPNIENHQGEDALIMNNMDSREASRDVCNKILYNFNILNTITDEEAHYRCEVFRDNRAIFKRRLHCTVCDIHIGCYPNVDMNDLTHPLLHVLICAGCKRKYCSVDFALMEMGKDVRCRWCSALATDAIPLRFCSQCPFGFCEKCIARNLPLESSSDQGWICCVCNMRSLWEARASLWGLKNYMERAKLGNTKWAGDLAQCCIKKRVKKNSSMPSNSNGVRNESYGINNYNNNSNNNNNSYYQNNNQQLIYYQQKEHSTAQPVQERFIIETTAIKKKLAYISSLIRRVQEVVDKTASELTDYAKDEYLKIKVGNVASFVTLSAEQLALACKALITNFEKQLEAAKKAQTEPPNGQYLIPNISNINHQMQLPVPQLIPIPHPSSGLQQLQESFEQQQINNATDKQLSLIPRPVQNLASFSLGPTGQLTAQFVGFGADGTIAAHQVNGNVIQNGVQLLDELPSTSFSPPPITNISPDIVNGDQKAIFEPPQSVLETVLTTTINDDKTLTVKTSGKSVRQKKTPKKLQKKSLTSVSTPKRKYVRKNKKAMQQYENIVEFNGIPIKKCFVTLTKLTDEQLKEISYKDGHAKIKANCDFIK